MERFDWYQASFPNVAEDELLGQWMQENPAMDFRPTMGRHGYTHGGAVSLGGSDVLRLLWGGNNDAPINVTASGSNSEGFASFARRHFPEHYVTRADACIDFEGVGAWDSLLDRVVDVKADFRLKSREQGDWLDGGVQGRTIYLGAPTSDVQFRLYEKGKKEGEGVDWVRAEVQVRPKKVARYAMASHSPEQCWGYSRWSLALRERLGASGVQRMVREVVQKQSLEHRFAALRRQYGRTINELFALLGTDEALGKALRTGVLPAAKP